MNERRSAPLGRGIALVLRGGTLIAAALVVAGLVLASVGGGDGPGPTPVASLLGSGTPDALIGAGILALTLTPAVAVAVATASFVRDGERGRAVTAAAVLVLLIASLVTAGVIGSAS